MKNDRADNVLSAARARRGHGHAWHWSGGGLFQCGCGAICTWVGANETATGMPETPWRAPTPKTTQPSDADLVALFWRSHLDDKYLVDDIIAWLDCQTPGRWSERRYVTALGVVQETGGD